MTLSFAQRLGMAIALLMAATNLARATPIAIRFTGKVEEVTDLAGLLGPRVTAGSSFTAVMRYDTELPNAVPVTNHRQWFHAPGLSSLTLDLDGAHFETHAGSTGQTDVVNNGVIGFTTGWTPPPIGDSFIAGWRNLQGPGPDLSISVSLHLYDYKSMAFAIDDLPASLDAAAFDELTINLFGFRAAPPGGVPTSYTVRLLPESFSVVPEPATVVLAALGGVALFACRARRRRRERGRVRFC